MLRVRTEAGQGRWRKGGKESTMVDSVRSEDDKTERGGEGSRHPE